MEKKTLTVEEAAGILGISRGHAFHAVQRGEIPAIRIGCRILIPKSKLEEMLECKIEASVIAVTEDA